MKKFIESSIEINAPSSAVWRVFTEPELTKKMGGEYVSGWKVGSSFGWRGLNGAMYTRGTILNIEPGRLLQHNLFEMNTTDDKHPAVICTVTYTFHESCNGTTRLTAREEFNEPIDDDKYEEASKGWDAELNALKEVAESIS